MGDGDTPFMPPGVILSAPDPAHYPAIAALHASCFDESWNKATISRVLAMPGAFGLLALTPEGDAAGPALLGFALCRVAADECELLSLAVTETARGRGIGGGLVDCVLDRLAAMAGQGKTIRRLFLEVAEDNDAAQRLYRKRGFHPVGRRPGYYRRRHGPAMAALTFALAFKNDGDD